MVIEQAKLSDIEELKEELGSDGLSFVYMHKNDVDK